MTRAVIRVLLAEDSEPILSVLAALLPGAGHHRGAIAADARRGVDDARRLGLIQRREGDRRPARVQFDGPVIDPGELPEFAG